MKKLTDFVKYKDKNVLVFKIPGYEHLGNITIEEIERRSVLDTKLNLNRYHYHIKVSRNEKSAIFDYYSSAEAFQKKIDHLDKKMKTSAFLVLLTEANLYYDNDLKTFTESCLFNSKREAEMEYAACKAEYNKMVDVLGVSDIELITMEHVINDMLKKMK